MFFDTFVPLSHQRAESVSITERDAKDRITRIRAVYPSIIVEWEVAWEGPDGAEVASITALAYEEV